MQPKRLVTPTLNRQNPSFAQTTTNLNPVATPFRDVTSNFTHREFQTADFDTEELGGNEFAALDYALPDLNDPRLLRLVSATNGSRSARAHSVYQMGKRSFDFTVAAVVLLFASPLLIMLAILVKLSSKGPVFFAHRRLGQDGREFKCLKFRTMIANAEDRLRNDPELRKRFEEKYKLEDDPRITPLGSFLRKTSLDELPQLLHVLRGEMSLVGPRPIVEDELSKYSIYAQKLLTVKPGLSGLWQVCGRSETTYPQRVMMDMHYIDHRCMGLDLRLLALTATAVVRKSGAW